MHNSNTIIEQLINVTMPSGAADARQAYREALQSLRSWTAPNTRWRSCWTPCRCIEH